MIRKLLLRSWFYFQKGYSTYLALPIGLASISTTLYYLAIKSIPYLTRIFPNFSSFILVFPLIYPIGVILGWAHFKKTNVFQTEQEIIVQSSQYTTKQITPLSLLTWTLHKAQAEELGLYEIAAQMDEVIERSRT